MDTVAYAWFQLTTPDEWDLLWRFGIASDRGLLRTDSTITHWGEDFWGYWSDPFPYVDGAIVRDTGISTSSYALTFLEDGSVDVTRTLIELAYSTSHEDTTITHLGIFAPETP